MIVNHKKGVFYIKFSRKVWKCSIKNVMFILHRRYNMLIKYTIENFKSFKNEHEINLVASKTSDNIENTLKVEDESFQLLPSTIIYGGNGSGKTNSLLALSNLKEFVIKSLLLQEGDELSYTPYKLDETCLNKPTSTSIVFIQNKIRYYYGFSSNNERIVEEFLYYYPNGRQKKIFVREYDEYTFSEDRTELETLSTRTLKNRLFLSVASEWKHEKCLVAFSYIKNNIVMAPGNDFNDWLPYTAKTVSNNLDIKDKMIKIFKELNIGIEDIESNIEEKKLDEKDIPKELPVELRNLLMSGESTKLEIKTHHIGKNVIGEKSIVKFDMNEESKGTQRLFELLGPWFDILNSGKVVIVDELSNSLHPEIVKYLVSMFHDPRINKKNAQLIFTSHDLYLLDLDFYRRDQIWFVEKTNDGESELYSLSDINNVRKDENIFRGYLNGKYGAMPKIREGLLYE